MACSKCGVEITSSEPHKEDLPPSWVSDIDTGAFSKLKSVSNFSIEPKMRCGGAALAMWASLQKLKQTQKVKINLGIYANKVVNGWQ